MFRGSTKIFVPECNLANEASHMANMVKKMPDVITYEHKPGVVGVLKTHTNTDEYVYWFDHRLRNETESLFFDYEFFTTTPGKTVKEIKGLAQEQLERYHIEYKEERDVYGKPKQVITGKMGPGMQDDLAIAILMGVYWGRVAIKNVRRRAGH